MAWNRGGGPGRPASSAFGRMGDAGSGRGGGDMKWGIGTDLGRGRDTNHRVSKSTVPAAWETPKTLRSKGFPCGLMIS